MRVLVFFDLPVVTSDNMRDYRMFRKRLIKSGFIMVQESVYSKLAPNSTVADGIITGLKNGLPKAGVVQVLKVTEKQYSSMDFLVGSRKTDVLDSDERLVIL